MDHYKTLGLKEGTSQEEIKTAYDKLSKELNPSNNDNQEFFKEEYEKVQEAYKELRNSSILTTKKGVQKHERKPFKSSIKNTKDSPPIPIKNKLPNHKKSKLMNTYSKIIGVILTLTLLIGFGLITFIIIDNSSFEDEFNYKSVVCSLYCFFTLYVPS